MNIRFELTINSNGQCDIVDWVESKETKAICKYNNLGSISYFSSAPQLCNLLNELYEENQNLRELLEISLDVSQDEIDEELRRKKND